MSVNLPLRPEKEEDFLINIFVVGISKIYEIRYDNKQ
jgi:hypothetical protein